MSVLAQSLPQQGRDAIQRAWRDVGMAPHGIQNFMAREHVSGLAGQQREHGECLRFQRLFNAVPGQAMALEVDFDIGEADAGEWRFRIRHDACWPHDKTL
ncbi:MAG TPA: hypothetical protein VFN29_00685 [Chiayiivirga sp.]|nr:hypothetical protein [Chiayiivirga sp.]